MGGEAFKFFSVRAITGEQKMDIRTRCEHTLRSLKQVGNPLFSSHRAGLDYEDAFRRNRVTPTEFYPARGSERRPPKIHAVVEQFQPLWRYGTVGDVALVDEGAYAECFFHGQ